MNLAPLLARRTPFFYGWVVLLSAGSCNFVRNAAASLTIAVFVYPLSQELGWSRTMIAGAASLGGLAATFASPAVGWAVDRFGARSVLTLSVFVLGLATISLAWATATVPLFGAAVPWAFYLACGTGRVIFSSPVPIATSVVVSRWFVRMRGRVNGMLSAAHSAGMVLFPLLASVIIARDGWREAWVVLGLVVWGVALLPSWLLTAQSPEDVGLRPDGDPADPPEDSASPPQEEPGWTLAEAVRTPALWILAIGTGALFLIQAGTNTHAAAFFRDQGLGAATAGLAISLNAAFLGIGGLVWGRVVEGCAPRCVMAAVALVMAAGSALFVGADTAAEALACSAVFGFGLGGMLTVPPVAFADYFGRRSLGAIRGATEPFTTFGQAVGALVPGVVFDHLTAPGRESYVPAFAAFAVLGAVTALVLLLARPPASRPRPDERTTVTTPLHRLRWQRPDQPVLSAMTTDQAWCRVQLYYPTVVFAKGRYRMWYLGNCTATRTADMCLGYAESADGLSWTPHEANPILTVADLPFGSSWGSPHVIFDEEEGLFRMWFVSLAGRRSDEGRLVDIDQKLGYASSPDGLRWEVHPEPVHPEGHGPFVMKDGPAAWRMWMNSSPDPEGGFQDRVSHIYRFESADGLSWRRDPEPMLSATETRHSVIYPWVMRDGKAYTMWYACHVGESLFEIFCSTSEDGLTWTHHLEEPVLPATRDPDTFDGRYTSTPCVLDDGGRYLMYYCTRDHGNLYGAGDGRVLSDRAGIYRHIGVAHSPKE